MIIERSDESQIVSNTIAETPSYGKHAIGKAHALMFGFLLLGLLAAIGHHQFYSYLDNLEVSSVSLPQQWIIRFGIAFAFLVKLAFAAAITVAYSQAFWFYVRRRPIRINSLDTIFGLLYDPLWFLNSKIIRQMTWLFVLASISSLLPLCAIFSPGTLTVIPKKKVLSANITAPVIGNLDEDHGLAQFPGAYWLYDTGYRVLMSHEVTSWPSPCGVNCSYTVSFAGPAYECVEMGPFFSLSVNLTDLWSQNINDRSQNPLPFINGSVFYIGLDDFGNKTSPIKFWAVYNQLNRTLRCDLHNATYTTKISYLNNVQFVQTDVVRNNPVNDGNRLFEDYVIDLFDVHLFLIHETVVGMLSGWVAQIGPILYTESYVANWDGVVELRNSTPKLIFPDNLGSIIEDFIVNVTLTQNVFRNNSDPDIASFIVEKATVATVTTYPPIYTYSTSVLWQIYGTALAMSMACIVVGSYMLFKNGTFGSLSFSQVLVATRNPTLDRLCKDDGLQQAPLRYGALGATGHMCFGIDSEITS